MQGFRTKQPRPTTAVQPRGTLTRNAAPMPLLGQSTQINRSLAKLPEPGEHLLSLNSLSVSDVPSQLPAGGGSQAKNMKGNYHSSRQVGRGNSSQNVRPPFQQEPINKMPLESSNYGKSATGLTEDSVGSRYAGVKTAFSSKQMLNQP